MIDHAQRSVPNSAYGNYDDPIFTSQMDEDIKEESGQINYHHRHMSWTGPSHRPSTSPKFSPVCKSSYSSLPQTTAVMFLSSFAENDMEGFGPTEIYEGCHIQGYVIGKIIGKGASSQVREGYLKDEPNVRLAMKIVQHDGFYESVEHEIEIWSQLDHIGFLRLIDVIKLHDVTIAVSPLAEKGSLLRHLQKQGAMPANSAKKIFKTLCESLGYLHEEHRIVHHDIKLENILLDKNMGAYLCDFGLSEYIDDYSSWCFAKSSQEDLLMKGSLWYLPPEIIDCSRQRRRSMINNPAFTEEDWKLEKTKVDVWALGIVLYAMITGSLPFTHDYLPKLQLAITSGEYPKLDEEIERPLSDLIACLLTVNPEERPLIRDVLLHEWLR